MKPRGFSFYSHSFTCALFAYYYCRLVVVFVDCEFSFNFLDSHVVSSIGQRRIVRIAVAVVKHKAAH